MDRTIRSSALLIAMLVVSAAPAAGANEDDAADSSQSSALVEALTYISPETRTFSFTDWDALKTAKGIEILDSSIPESLRFDGMQALTRDEAVFTGFGLPYFRGHLEAWGWDSSDISWDATFDTPDGIVWVVRLRDDLDLSTFVGFLDEREFEKRDLNDSVIYSHEMDFETDWLRSTELAMLNVALLGDGHTLVLASGPEAIEGALKAKAFFFPSNLAGSPAGIVAASLGPVMSAVMELSDTACEGYDPRRFESTTPEQLASIGELPELGHWLALGLSVRLEQGQPARTRVAMLAPDPETAAADLPLREELARDGYSVTYEAPYAEAVFGVEASSLEGPVMMLDLVSVEDRHRAIEQAVLRRDLLAAVCA